MSEKASKSSGAQEQLQEQQRRRAAEERRRRQAREAQRLAELNTPAPPPPKPQGPPSFLAGISELVGPSLSTAPWWASATSAAVPPKREPPQIMVAEKRAPRGKADPNAKVDPNSVAKPGTVSTTSAPAAPSIPGADHILSQDNIDGRGGLNTKGVSIGVDERTGKDNSDGGSIGTDGSSLSIDATRTRGPNNGLDLGITLGKDGGGGRLGGTYRGVKANGSVTVVDGKEMASLDGTGSGGGGGNAADLLGGEVLTSGKTDAVSWKFGGGTTAASVEASGARFNSTQFHRKLTPERKLELFGKEGPEAMKRTNPKAYEAKIRSELARGNEKVGKLSDVQLGDGSSTAGRWNAKNRSTLNTGDAVTFTEGYENGGGLSLNTPKVGVGVDGKTARVEQTTLARDADNSYKVNVANMSEDTFNLSLNTAGGVAGVSAGNADTDLQQTSFTAKGKEGVRSLKRFQKTGPLPNLERVVPQERMARFHKLEKAVDAASGEKKTALMAELRGESRTINNEVLANEKIDLTEIEGGGVTYDATTRAERKKQEAKVSLLGLDIPGWSRDETTTDTVYRDADGKKLEASNDLTEFDLVAGTERNRITADPKKNPKVAFSVDTDKAADQRDRDFFKNYGGADRGPLGKEFVEGEGPYRRFKAGMVVTNGQMEQVRQNTKFDAGFFEDATPGFLEEREGEVTEANKDRPEKKHMMPLEKLTESEAGLKVLKEDAETALVEKGGKPGGLATYLSTVKTAEDFKAMPKPVQEFMIRDLSASKAASGENNWKKTLQLASLIEDPETKARVLRGIGKDATDFGSRNMTMDLFVEMHELESTLKLPKGELTQNARVEISDPRQDAQNAKIDGARDSREVQDLIDGDIRNANAENDRSFFWYTPAGKAMELAGKLLGSIYEWGEEGSRDGNARNVVRSLNRIEETKGRQAAIDHVKAAKAKLSPEAWQTYKKNLGSSWPGGLEKIEALEQEAEAKLEKAA